MPYQPVEPSVTPVPIPQEKEIDTFHITEINIYTSPNNQSATKAAVYWEEGYIDDEGKFVSVRRKKHLCQGQAFLTKMMTQVPDGNTYYSAVKLGFWEFLQESEDENGDSLLPEGSVS